MFELERMFAIPQASKNLSILMTSLLITPFTRKKLDQRPPMPYKIWTRELLRKVSGWYKLYVKSNNDAQSVFEKIGIEPLFWKIMGDWNPLEEYQFHELTFHQRVHLVKALCDYIFQKYKTLRDNISEKVEEYGSYLGEDRSGARFLYFPQFLDQDVRIYRQNKEAKSWIDRDLQHIAELKHETSLESSESLNYAPRRRKKRSGWKKEKISKTHKVSKNVNRLNSEDTSCNSSKSVPTVERVTVPDAREKSHKEQPMNEEVFEEENKLSQRIQESSLPINDAIENCGAFKSEITISSSDGNKTSNGPENKSDLIDTLDEKCINGEISENNSLRTSKVRTPDKEVSTGPIEHEHEKKVEPIIVVRDKNNFAVKDMPLSSEGAETAFRRPLYNPYWLVPDPDDFTLVADSVEGVRQLLEKYCNNDDLPLSERLDNIKTQRGKYPSCEVRLSRRLTALLSDLESVELKMIVNVRMTREKLFSEWKDHLNRPADYEDPDEAFWLDEKEPVDVPECFTPEAPCPSNLDVVENVELPEIKTEDEHFVEGGMKLRNRNLEDRRLNIESPEDSTEEDSDESDNWVMPKKRKRKRNKVLKITDSSLQACSVMTEEQSCRQGECKQSTVTADSEPEIEILEVPKCPLETPVLRVKKRLFQQQEKVSSTEANSQFKLEKNSETFLKSVSRKQASSETNSPITPTSNSKTILYNNGVTTNSKVLPKLQDRKISANAEMGSIHSGSVTGQNHDRSNTADQLLNSSASVKGIGKHCGTTEQERVLKNIVHVFKEADKSTSDDQQPIVLVPSVSNMGHTVLYEKVVGEKAKEILENTKRNTNSTNHNSQKVQNLTVHPQVQAVPTIIPKKTEEIVCISDDSDGSEVEFLDVVYNPKLDRNYKPKNPHQKTSRLINRNSPSTSSALIIKEGNSVESVTKSPSITSAATSMLAVHSKSTEVAHVQSPGISVPQVQNSSTPLPQVRCSETPVLQTQSPVAVEFLDVVYNPKLDRNYKPKNPRQNRSRITNRNSPSTSSALIKEGNSVESLTKSPSITSAATSMMVVHSKSTEVAHVQSPSISVPQVQSSSTPLPQVRCSETPVLQTQSPLTSVSQLQSPGTPVLQLHSPRTLASQLQRPGTLSQLQNPGTPTLHLRSPGTPVSQLRGPGNPVAQLRSPGTPVSQSKSSGSPVSRLQSPGTPVAQLQSPGTSVAQWQSPGAPVTQLQNPGTPVTQVRSPITSVAQVRSPGTPVTQLQSPGTPVAQVRSPGIPVAQVRSPGIPVAQVRGPGTPVAHLRSPGTPVTQLRSPGTPVAQLRSPGIPVAQVRSPGTPVAQLRSPGTLVVQVQSPGTPVAQVQSPATPVAQLRSPGTPVAQLRSPDTPMAQLRNPGTPVTQLRSPGTPVAQLQSPGTLVLQVRSPATPVTQLRSPGTPVAQLRSPGTPVTQLRSPATPVTQLRSPGTPVAQLRSPGTPVTQLRSPATSVTQLMRPRSSTSQIRTDVQVMNQNIPRHTAQVKSPRLLSPQVQVRNPTCSPKQSGNQHPTGQTTARLIVIFDGTSSNYALAFPNGKKVILNPEQLARLRADNGGQLTTNIDVNVNFEL
ncbi:uncharacterized bromodomain-containing protein 10-like isoform X2 [Periplaneta americana]